MGQGEVRSITENMSQREILAALREIRIHVTPLIGDAAPAASATFVGQEYLDRLTPRWWKSVTVGSGAADWVAIS